MANINNFLLGHVFHPTQGCYQNTATQSPWLHLKCKYDTGSGASLAIAAGGDMAFTTDGTTADTTISTDGTIDLSTPAAGENTMGEVLDVINASPYWEGYLLGILRSTGTAGGNWLTTVTEVDLSTAAYKSTGVYLYGDAAVDPYVFSYAITGFDPVNGYDDTNCMSWLQYVTTDIDVNSAGTLNIYSSSQTADHLIFTCALNDNSATTLGSLTNTVPFIASRQGERLVVYADSDQDATTSSGYFSCLGYSIDMSGEHICNHTPLNANLT